MNRHEGPPPILERPRALVDPARDALADLARFVGRRD